MPASDERMRSFLLGTMAEPARREVEEVFFESQQVYEDLQDSLNDLIDAYARGELDVAEKRLVEERLLGSSRNRAKLALARALAQRELREQSESPVSRTATLVPRRLGWLTAAACLAAACAAGLMWLGIQNLRLRRDVARLQSTSQEQRPGAAPEVALVSLFPQLKRGNEQVPAIALSPKKIFLRVDLATSEICAGYSVEVESLGRGRIWSQQSLARGANGAVTVWLPAGDITAGTYEFLLYGIQGVQRELLGSYPCRIEIAAESPISTKPAQ
ncbi:MAG TPA: hypothetical protein VKU01_21475 [Bryobacteraceae bacterium]|nr:hypothetical protein [Bryobacteraceae bacterium]